MTRNTEGPITQRFRELAERDAFRGTHMTNALIEAIAHLETNQRGLETKLLVLRDQPRRDGATQP